MPKIKQVSSKRLSANQVGFQPPHRAVKSVRISDGRYDAPDKVPLVPRKVNRIISSQSQPRGAQRARRQIDLRKSRFMEYSIPRRSFQRLCRDIAYKYMPECRFTLQALMALQMAIEDFMVGIFEDAAMCMRHAKRKTLLVKDIELVAKLRKLEYEPL